MAGTRRQWGWHPFRPHWAERIVADAGIRPGPGPRLGAGRGALTEPLLAAGADVIAVEAHPGRASELRRRFGDAVTRGPGRRCRSPSSPPSVPRRRSPP
ncbi:MAG TPA: hypothetical protein VGR26_16015 [Acidimicrobiales bacterium]|nr:hypothetical protein [Acidimicrobiales bacterium]